MAMTLGGGWLAWVVRWAARLGRWSPWVALGLCLPALAGGLALDDLYLSTASGDVGQFAQSAFTVVGDGQRPAHFASEDLPWWSAHGVQLDFFRPVAAVTHAIARHRDEPFFASLQWVYAGPGTLTLSRPSERALVLTSSLPWLAAPLDRGFRGDVDYQVGDQVPRRCFDVTIEAVDAGHPTSIRLETDPSCELTWLAWLDGGPAPIELPAVGEQRELPPATF